MKLKKAVLAGLFALSLVLSTVMSAAPLLAGGKVGGSMDECVTATCP